MSRTKRWIIIFLSIIAIILIGLNITGSDNDEPIIVDNNEPTYTSEQAITRVYNLTGGLNYRLVTENVEYFAADSTSWFTKPVMTQYDEKKLATWEIRADRAKLTNDRMLYLYGNVVVNALTPDAQLRKITTDNASINLTTQDISSDDQVTLYGTSFNSSGMKMRGNLRNKTAQLIEKVKTSYEIQTQQTQP